MPNLVLYAVPGFLALMFLEMAIAAYRGLDLYERRDTVASLGLGVANVIVNAACKGATLGLHYWLYDHRLFELGTGWPAWVLLFFAYDVVYYWWHRASHEVRFMWAAHVNHHSSERMNLSTALRQSFTTPFTSLLAYWVLPLVGFEPIMVLTMGGISLIYQFWIHTELIDRLGPLEAVLNTASHHRVHHGANLEYLDRNHAAILIVWDKLFGTFEPERARVRYGLTKNIHTFNLWRIGFHDWADMIRQVRGATSWRERLGYVFLPPGWSPDGSTLTAAQLRRA